ncbi:MAG: diphosphate--fructose-6-phosphate 1-phosphotransferase, partial [Lachnospiraceae bacterium]|nr:diphosphate--fructose-6-phosphate 1-phosphotransferase [Lachnospiraceae bacterium]
MKMNILVAHGGGPTPVINSSLQGLIEAARENESIGKIYAARFGAEGILKKDLIDLTDVPASQISLLGVTPASAIGSCRKKLGEEDLPAVLDCIREFEIGAFFYNGGNDSMDTCNKINELALKEGLDLKVIGIPKTIDNDLDITDHCPGFGSAARYAAITAAELSQDAMALPIHVIVMEVMGRNAGWLTAASAMAQRLTGCEQLTYLPEICVDTDRLLADVEKAYAKGKGLLVTISEGARGADGSPLADSGIVDGFGHSVPGGTAQYVSTLIMSRLGLKSRAEKPGLIGRTCMACVSDTDRKEAYAVGRYALRAAVSGESGQMVAIQADRSDGYSSSMFLTPLSG